MQDQRIIASTLENIEQALESAGEQRPPGLFVVGWSVLALWGKGDVTVLDKGSISDEERIGRWLGEGHRWRIEDGLDERWSSL
jgi:uroporphyrin-III C-methyltransferase